LSPLFTASCGTSSRIDEYYRISMKLFCDWHAIHPAVLCVAASNRKRGESKNYKVSYIVGSCCLLLYTHQLVLYQ
jgi:hypothetical protein